MDLAIICAQEKAFDEATGSLRQAKELSVNKVGHGV
jgi:Flp pilus assembly protein TadD